ncbi:hypothetical protein HPP92_005455 [Vanilla planifolia]|uniref:Uncharacterized protein n=1 Tax=Vanilla planifolia TaxID=51239 RepID=A0A835RU30_VANPL|nr:hypothetical protein HPP92_005455 [Vanilla planifolia]
MLEVSFFLPTTTTIGKNPLNQVLSVVFKVDGEPPRSLFRKPPDRLKIRLSMVRRSPTSLFRDLHDRSGVQRREFGELGRMTTPAEKGERGKHQKRK